MYKCCLVLLAVFVAAWATECFRAETVDYQIRLETLLQAKEGGHWFQPRPAPIPALGHDGKPAVVMVAMQILGSDYFTGPSSMRTFDLGKTWSKPQAAPALAWRDVDDGTPVVKIGVCDFQLGWHAPSQRVLGIGHTVRYTKTGFAGFGYRRDVAQTSCETLTHQ